MYVRDLNFVMQSEIFVNFVGQLRASHLILNSFLVYSTWQPFRQALLVDSPLLSYIDMRHPNFLPLNLTVGKAQDLGPWLVRADLLVPVRDASTNSVFQGRAVHKPMKEPHAEVQPAEQAKVEFVNSSKA